MAKKLDLRIAANGRIVLPLALRRAMGISGDTKIVATLEGDEVRLTPLHHSAKRAQELYRAHASSQSTVDEFLAERRTQAESEDAEMRSSRTGSQRNA